MKSKEEVHKELEEKVEKYMQIFWSCSQSGFQALNEEFDLKADDVTFALKPFSGGAAGNGEVCGAVTGALLALGLYFETKVRQTENSLFPEYAVSFVKGIEKEYGSTRCYRIQTRQFGRYYDFLNPDELAMFIDAAKSGKCTEVVKKAVILAGDIIYSHELKHEKIDE